MSEALRLNSDDGLAKRIAKLEQRARKAIESGVGRPFEDRDWIQMKGKLAEFYAILQDWEKQTKNHPSPVSNWT